MSTVKHHDDIVAGGKKGGTIISVEPQWGLYNIMALAGGF